MTDDILINAFIYFYLQIMFGYNYLTMKNYEQQI